MLSLLWESRTGTAVYFERSMRADTNGRPQRNRMDGRHLESGDRVHQNHDWL